MSSKQIYWINGEFIPADDAQVSLRDVGVLRGYGVFDYLRTYDFKPFHLMEHLTRLKSSADQIGLSVPYDLEEIADSTEALIQENGQPNVGIRFLVTGGESTNGFTPPERSNLAIMLEPITVRPDTQYREGCKLITSRLQREFPTVKSTNYIGAIMAMQEAEAAGAVEALYVDHNDEISECTRSNFFIVQDGILKTAEKNVLPGITRNVLLSYAEEIVPVVIGAVFLDDLQSADEAFITSSTKEVLPIVQIDDTTIGDGKVGPITQALGARFKQEI